MEEILTTVDELRTTVRREDILIVCGGSNNFSKNNTKKAISSVSDFAKNNSGSNIILINAPHRHDLTHIRVSTKKW
jgi:alkaline phosphatase